MTIGGKIQYYRKLNDFSQEVLAVKIGVSRQAISNWEKNVSIPDLVNGNKLCLIFNITIDELLNNSIEEINQTHQNKYLISGLNQKIIISHILKLILILVSFFAFNHLLGLYLEKAKETYQFNFTIFYTLQLAPYFLAGIIVYFKIENLKGSLRLLLACALNTFFLFIVFSILTNPFLPVFNQVNNMWLRALVLFIFGVYLSYLSYKSI